MKLSGFTIVRNAVINGYPFVESIQSILPVVDEMIISIGDGEDNTEELIRNIKSPKIRIVHSVWDPNLRRCGEVLAVETDKALRQISPDSDWAFYIQADEVIHEQFLPVIRAAAEKYAEDPRVDGLLFDYLHFYGTYDFVGDSRKWYNREVRVVRNDSQIKAYRDAQGFRKAGRKLNVKLSGGCVYHYGWVKSPGKMKEKLKHVHRFWEESDGSKKTAEILAGEIFNFNDYDVLARFNGSHPAVMKDRIRAMDWHIEFDINRKKLKAKDRMLHWVEKQTGRRLFDFRNYQRI